MEVSIGIGANGVYSIALQPDGKVLIGGGFIPVTNRTSIGRLNADGSPDAVSIRAQAQTATFILSFCNLMARRLIAGHFTTFNGTNRNRMARSCRWRSRRQFQSGKRSANSVTSLIVQTDGKLLIGGAGDGLSRAGITRLNANGSGDATF